MVPLLKAPAIDQSEEAEKARLWELLLHTEHTLAQRTNVFLMAEAVVMLSYSVILALRPLNSLAFIVCGLALSLAWLGLQYKTLSELSALSLRVKDADISKHYSAWRDECKQYITSHEIVTLVFPLLALIGWFLAAAFNS